MVLLESTLYRNVVFLDEPVPKMIGFPFHTRTLTHDGAQNRDVPPPPLHGRSSSSTAHTAGGRRRRRQRLLRRGISPPRTTSPPFSARSTWLIRFLHRQTVLRALVPRQFARHRLPVRSILRQPPCCKLEPRPRRLQPQLPRSQQLAVVIVDRSSFPLVDARVRPHARAVSVTGATDAVRARAPNRIESIESIESNRSTPRDDGFVDASVSSSRDGARSSRRRRSSRARERRRR